MIGKVLVSVLLITALSGCASRTEYGRCIGVNGDEDPTLKYEYSGRNIALGIIFVELIAPPIIVVLNELKCPVSKKEEKK